MAQNSPITDLDASQVIQRVFDVADDSIRIVGNITATNPSVGTDGTTAPTSSTQVGGTGPDGNLHAITTDNNGNQNVNVLNSLVPTAYNEIDLTYVVSGNGAGQIQTATYKLNTVTVKTLTITYDTNNNISTVVAS